MTGYGQPPKDTRFKKGQSGNPNGRPKGRSIRTTDSAKATLAAGAKMMTVRENGISREISVVQGIELAQQRSALSGSSLAQEHFLDRHRAAELERRAELDDEIAWGQDLVAGLLWLREVSAAKGKETPMPYPHPDDVFIDMELGVRFAGPIDAESDAKLQNVLRTRDVLFAQDSFDYRRWSGEASETTDSRPGTAAVLAWLINGAVPKRYRLSDVDVIMMYMRNDGMTKRALAKHHYQTWKGLGVNIARGTVFVPVVKGHRRLAELFDWLARPLKA